MLRRLGGHARQNVIAYLALFFALSGGAVAANAALKVGDAAGGDLTGTYPNPTIDANKVNSAKVDNDSLTGADVDESTLGKVGDADTLDGIDSTGFSSRLTEATHYELIAERTLDGGETGIVEIDCLPGDEPTGGGFSLQSEEMQVLRSWLVDDFDGEPGGDEIDDDGWQVQAVNNSANPRSVGVLVRCIDLP